LTGGPGDYEAVVAVAPRYVTEACTICGECAKVCPAEVSDDFNFGLTKTRAVSIQRPGAFPAVYAIQRAACPSGCRACVDSCKYGAINLEQGGEEKKFRVASVVVATGWAPYDATKIENLGFGKCANVITNVILERLAAAGGPTGGKVLRPSDGKEPKSVAFVQCAGSRDENHLPYCSAVCCPASLKQATYIRKLYPEAKVSIFYIDVRTAGRLQEFGAKVRADEGIELVKGKIAKVEEDPATGNLLVTGEDIGQGKKSTRSFDLVVLATGIVPQTSGVLPGLVLDEFGFVAGNGDKGWYGAGCAKRPAEVAAVARDATGMALKALQIATGATHNG
jgi:quinone-modifying oxidoreductase subunit QmoA